MVLALLEGKALSTAVIMQDDGDPPLLSIVKLLNDISPETKSLSLSPSKSKHSRQEPECLSADLKSSSKSVIPGFVILPEHVSFNVKVLLKLFSEANPQHLFFTSYTKLSHVP